MNSEKKLDYDEMMISKEKRRLSREKGKKTLEDNKPVKKNPKRKSGKKINYDPTVDYDDFDYDQYK